MDKYPGASKKISIHALREEGDLAGLVVVLCHLVFLSTPSARRATNAGLSIFWSLKFLSTPSARRATLIFLVFFAVLVFLSTPSARRATVQ